MSSTNNTIDLLALPPPSQTPWKILPSYTPIIGQENCTFPPSIFLSALLNILKNPNITSSHLFRADILYDSDGTSDASSTSDIQNADQDGGSLAESDAFPAEIPEGFGKVRTLIRRLVPRNPQLDRPLTQSCHVLEKVEGGGRHVFVVQCIPHVKSAEGIPWYHPCVKGLLYVYSWILNSDDEAESQQSSTAMTTSTALNTTSNLDNSPETATVGKASLSVHHALFPDTALPLSNRLSRTAHHLLTTLSKHGHGRANGYTKKFHHDLLVPQSRVQNTYSVLKKLHSKRLCDSWVEVTEPSKHVFEDLAIAAFLIEFWRDTYRDPEGVERELPPPPPPPSEEGNGEKPAFPGFVDIGCGNGVLTEILLACGFPGWGFDARRRKTWKILGKPSRERLEEKILVPQPLLSDEPILLPEKHVPAPVLEEEANPTVFSYLKSAVATLSLNPSAHPANLTNDQDKWHNGLFPRGTFIISNHADELTAWTPLLASLSSSPFLAIPCCSHNLSGTRFRAPSLYTNFTADAAAPNYFAKEKQKGAKSKHIAIHIPLTDEAEAVGAMPNPVNKQDAPETGDLKQLSVGNRAKQPSAYSSLCDWVAALADEVGYDVEKENLRIPSTRNMAIIGRRWQGQPSGVVGAEPVDVGEERRVSQEAWDMVMNILEREKADSGAWVERARSLMAGKADARVNHG